MWLLSPKPQLTLGHAAGVKPPSSSAVALTAVQSTQNHMALNQAGIHNPPHKPPTWPNSLGTQAPPRWHALSTALLFPVSTPLRTVALLQKCMLPTPSPVPGSTERQDKQKLYCRVSEYLRCDVLVCIRWDDRHHTAFSLRQRQVLDRAPLHSRPPRTSDLQNFSS